MTKSTPRVQGGLPRDSRSDLPFEVGHETSAGSPSIGSAGPSTSSTTISRSAADVSIAGSTTWACWSVSTPHLAARDTFAHQSRTYRRLLEDRVTRPKVSPLCSPSVTADDVGVTHRVACERDLETARPQAPTPDRDLMMRTGGHPFYRARLCRWPPRLPGLTATMR